MLAAADKVETADVLHRASLMPQLSPLKTQSPWLAPSACRDPVNGGTRLAGVTGYSQKGTRELYVDNPGSFKKGQWVRLVLADSGETIRDGLCDEAEALQR